MILRKMFEFSRFYLPEDAKVIKDWRRRSVARSLSQSDVWGGDSFQYGIQAPPRCGGKNTPNG